MSKTILIEGRKVVVSNENTQKLFTAYAGMDERNLLEFANSLGMSLDDATEIYTTYGWAQKIKDYDDIREREFEDWYKQRSKKIRKLLTGQLDNLLASLEQSSLGSTLEIQSLADLKIAAATYGDLVKATELIARRPITAQEIGGATSWSDLLESSGDLIGDSGR